MNDEIYGGACRSRAPRVRHGDDDGHAPAGAVAGADGVVAELQYVPRPLAAVRAAGQVSGGELVLEPVRLGHVNVARELFALVGISYIPAVYS